MLQIKMCYQRFHATSRSISFAPVASDTAIRLIIGMYLYCNILYKCDDWVLEAFDVEAAFLNSDLETNVYIEWSEGMLELGLKTQEKQDNYYIELQKAMYGKIDSPLRWMKTISKDLTKGTKLERSSSYPFVFYKRKNG
jgi:hypothetical protein